MHQLRQSVHVLGRNRSYYFLRKSLIIRVFQILEVLVLLKNRSLAFLYGARPKSLLGIHLGKIYLRLLLGLFRFLGFGIRSLGAILRSLAAVSAAVVSCSLELQPAAASATVQTTIAVKIFFFIKSISSLLPYRHVSFFSVSGNFPLPATTVPGNGLYYTIRIS